MMRGRQGGVADHYDEFDPIYRRIWSEQPHHGLWRRGDESTSEAAQAMGRLVGERLGLRRGQRVCDVGCGYGHMAAELADAFGVSVLGLTVSSRQVERASGRADPGVEVRWADWLESALGDDAFDAVLAVESLEHMAQPARAVAEMARVLRPGGRVVLCCWLRSSDARPWETRHLLDPICREGQLAGMGTEDNVRAWLRAAGLELQGAEDLSRQVERTWPNCLRRSTAAFFRDPEVRRCLLARPRQSARFAIAAVRIWAAYALGAMRYVMFSAEKPGPSALA